MNLLTSSLINSAITRFLSFSFPYLVVAWWDYAKLEETVSETEVEDGKSSQKKCIDV